MVLVYVTKITPRISYVFKHMGKRLLGFELGLTSTLEQFIAHDGPKLSYGKQPLGSELYFQSVDLLFEFGINPIEVVCEPWGTEIGFFAVKHEQSALPFDIFAASFYLLSRYEEYLPHVKDELGRFDPDKSLAYQHGFMDIPVVDIWAKALKKVLIERFPDIYFRQRKFEILPVISVRQSFVFWQKGIWRTIIGALRDMWYLKFTEMTDRIRVLLGLVTDPFNTFGQIIEFKKKYKKRCIVFFGLGNYSAYENSIHYRNQKHRSLIKHVADYQDTGLRVSYEAVSDFQILKSEKKRMEGIVNKPLTQSFCAFGKITLPEAYRNMIELEVTNDYSMGYEKNGGFRAGTCSSFLFYDLDYEVQTPLTIYPFCFAVTNKDTITSINHVKEKMLFYMNQVESVQGTFIPVFGNAVLGAYGLGQDAFLELFEDVM